MAIYDYESFVAFFCLFMPVSGACVFNFFCAYSTFCNAKVSSQVTHIEIYLIIFVIRVNFLIFNVLPNLLGFRIKLKGRSETFCDFLIYLGIQMIFHTRAQSFSSWCVENSE